MKQNFTKPSKAEVNNIIVQIEKKVTEKKELFNSIGLKHGILGVSFFYFALSDYFGDKSYQEKGFIELQSCMDKLNSDYISPTLYREISEIGHFLEFCISKKWLTKDDIGETLNEIDIILEDVLDKEIASKNFDPVTGALAYGYYFLKRTDSERKIFAIKKLLDFIKSISYIDDSGNVYWKSVFKGKEQIYLGITHGISNVILFLLQVQDVLKKDKDDLDLIITRACNYIRSKEFESRPLIYPLIVDEEINNNVYPKNYCYGDFGTLYSLLKAYNKLDNNEGQKYVLERFVKSNSYGYGIPYINTGKSILYGSAGLSMLFRSFNCVSFSEEYQNAYYSKIEEVVKAFNINDEFLGYQGYWNQDSDITNYCLSEGMIGIALELICYQENVKLNEEFFFL